MMIFREPHSLSTMSDDAHFSMAHDGEVVPADALEPCRPRPAPSRSDLIVPPGTDLWVFGYGSLMWNPEFAHVEHRGALLRGYHRRFCVYSFRYRGTPERPGLVLGLDRGGSCRGIAFRVAAEDVPATLDYLWEREMISGVYRPKLLPVRLDSGESVPACTFVADREHGQYSGCLCPLTTARFIAQGIGERGPNFDYLANTVAHLHELGIRDHALERVLAEVRELSRPS
jgi:glutathione-specific gamma-glutamylcyclotransferase